MIPIKEEEIYQLLEPKILSELKGQQILDCLRIINLEK
jgi:hypothetical protein